MQRRNFLVSTAASMLAALTKVGPGKIWAAEAPKEPAPESGAQAELPASAGSKDFIPAVEIPGSWQAPVPGPRANFGFDPLHYETTFQELRPGRLSPVNTKTAVGLPGWPVMGFGYLMRARYSEFQMQFSVESGGRESMPHTLANFRQSSPGNWLPGAVTEWDQGGVHYQVSYIAAPNEPQPVDLYEIVVRNVGPEAEAQAHLLITLDGAETLKAEGDLIADRGKPLLVMDPVVPAERVARDAGCADPRATPAGPWGFGSMEMDEWRSHRDGWYGMPVEYLLRVRAHEKLKVFLGFERPFANGPEWGGTDWGSVPPGEGDPTIASLYSSMDREVIATVEGDEKPQRVSLNVLRKRVVLGFIGRDIDGDGYIRISVRATPESRQPATLSLVWGFDMGTPVTPEQLAKDGGLQLKARHRINVGEDLPRSIDDEPVHFGTDLTAFALRLRYEPKLSRGEEKRYQLRLPAIDKPEMAPYGNPWRPYDTGTSWMPYMEPRHPENKKEYGEDVPVGMDPARYAIDGPKSREVWKLQLAAARSMNWNEGMRRLDEHWNKFVAKATRFLTPEPYLDHLYKHQLAILKMHIIKIGTEETFDFQLTGPDWYWDLAVSRDLPYMCLAWDEASYPEVARSLWRTMLTRRKDLPRSHWTLGQWDDDAAHDGLWITRTHQWDAQGQFLWTLHLHFLFTQDHDWLAANYSKIERAANWIIRTVQAEKERLGKEDVTGYGLLPPAGREAGGPGHNYYVNCFAVLGMKTAARTAEAMGKHDDAVRFRRQGDELEQAFLRAIRFGFFRMNDFTGVFSSGPEWFPSKWTEKNGSKSAVDLPSTDYGCPLVWPTEVMSPFDPIMDAWFHYREAEGTKSGGMYGYIQIVTDMGISYIRRGEPDRAADWFYVYVANAAETCDWGETMTRDWVFPEFTPPRKAIRTEGQMPHGYGSAMYINYFRHLMLHEEGETLHIAPATPRKWLAQPQPIGVEGAPSEFGKVTYHLTADPDRTTIRGDVQLEGSRMPKRLLLHVRAPGGRGLASVKINGQSSSSFAGETIILTELSSKIEIEARIIA